MVQTHHVCVAWALAKLDYLEMVALAVAFERWAFTEERMSPDHRTTFVLKACDLERIAAFCGPSWRASDPGEEVDLMQFLARGELRRISTIFGPPNPIELSLDRLRLGAFAPSVVQYRSEAC